jgi:hypothetical protein
MLRDPESLAAKALGALGVDAAGVERELARLDPAGTSDELPERAGARRISIELVGDRLAVFLADDALRDRFTAALEGVPPVVEYGAPAAATFPALWQEFTRHVGDVIARLETEAAGRWRPPELDREWDVAAYTVVQAPGGMQGRLEVGEEYERSEVGAKLAKWLTDHQPDDSVPATYLALLVHKGEGRSWTYELSFGERPEWPRTQRQYLVAHAILDLSGEARGQRGA